jgi:hypothetical protein
VLAGARATARPKAGPATSLLLSCYWRKAENLPRTPAAGVPGPPQTRKSRSRVAEICRTTTAQPPTISRGCRHRISRKDPYTTRQCPPAPEASDLSRRLSRIVDEDRVVPIGRVELTDRRGCPHGTARRRAIRNREDIVVVLGVSQHGPAQAVQVRPAHHAIRQLAGPREGRHENAHQECQDGNDNQQLNQRETLPFYFRPLSEKD